MTSVPPIFDSGLKCVHTAKKLFYILLFEVILIGASVDSYIEPPEIIKNVEGAYHLDFIECEKILNAGYCADNDCACSLTPLPRGGGYIYVSDEVVEFRRDSLSLAEVQVKLESLTGSGEYISVSKYAPILICEEAAYRRNLDLVVAKADALMYWQEGKVPLRPTPQAKNHEELFTPESYPQFQQNDPEENSENVITTSSEGQQVRESGVPVNVPLESEPDPAVSKLAPPLRDVSVDEVVNQFSSGPLAELAKRMAQGMGNADSSENSSAGIIPETVIASGADVKPMNQEYQGNTLSSYSKKKKGSSGGESRKQKPVVSRNTVLSVLTVIGIILTLSVIAAITAVTIVKLRQPKPVAVVTQSPEPDEAESRVELSNSFFERSYSFVDAQCKGVISFTLTDELRGEYIQAVNLKGKDKTYRVHGIFTFTANSITFRPDSYSKDIVWILDEYDQNGNAVFRDPSESDLKAARVYLRRKD